MKFSALLFGLSSGLPIYNYVLAKHLAKNYNAPTLNMPTLNLNPLTADHKGFASEVIIPGMIADQVSLSTILTVSCLNPPFCTIFYNRPF